MRALTWNLFHGRSQPPAGRDLLDEFSAKLAAWRWDVALLQEVPPWWPAQLAAATGAQERHVLTSRNFGLPLRRAVAKRWPDVARSNGGGCNAVLARAEIVHAGSIRLRARPERRVAQTIRLADGLCVVNFHASTSAALARDELERLHEIARNWSAGAPLLLGGDLNLREPRLPMTLLARGEVDFLFAIGAQGEGEPTSPDRAASAGGVRVALSDHRPIVAELRYEPT